MIYTLANITNFTILFLTMTAVLTSTVLTLMNRGYTIKNFNDYIWIHM